MDNTELHQAQEDFLAVADAGGFGPPPAGEWDAGRLLAHMAVADAAIASVALAVIGGERAVYDNRASLDEWNLSRVIDECGDLAGLIEFVRGQGRLLRTVATEVSQAAGAVLLPVLIVSNDQLIVDEPWSLADLIGGVARFHLPQHAGQLARLR